MFPLYIIILYMKRLLICVLTLSLSIFLFSSCLNNGSTAKFMKDEHPEMILKNASYTIDKEDSNTVNMTAEKITVYSANRVVFDNSDFVQFDENMQTQITGQCDTATMTDGTNLTLSGNIVFNKLSDNAVISCDSVHWNNKTGSIASEGNLIISFEDGSAVHADSFSSNLNNSQYKFAGISNAQFNAKDDTSVSIRCESLSYDKENEKVLSESWIYISDESRKVNLTGARLEYDKNTSIMQIDMQAKFVKETDKGLLTCTAESMAYNTEEQTLTILGNAHVTWDKDTYRATMILIDLDTEEIQLAGPITGEIYG